ncbi:LysM peptidoglycan-binding domain-containing protein [Brachyspira catarrhinii]|uniref:Uncharacterized protein n=1 Tax=Brachyspira catarrhinii TaxID=2528966 RepID=A0ABY2TQ69_9SPIR|nr:hypothetical protein [Brachyspira catarrhinii]TKZ35030.1 hypothetical protein EZH24_07410 [Brachyspira catarrhinii]
MATKKTNNKKEETTKKVSAPKKSAEKEKTSKKQTSTSKKKIVSPVKKTDKKSSVKKSAGNSLSKNSKSSTGNKTYRTNTIRKIEPIKTEDIEKPERESIKLLREAIKAKSKTVSKPVAVKKHLIVKENEDTNDTKENDIKNESASSPAVSSIIKNDTENLNKVDFGINRFEKKEEISENNLTEKSEEKKSEVKTFTKNTYSKSDIFKRAVSIKNPIEAEELRKNIEETKFNQSEIDEAIENAATIEEDTPIEDYSVYSSKKLEELKRKNIPIIETEDEMKSGGIPEIERKPAEPYVAPPHSTIKKEKKSNKIVAIIGIIIIILGLSYLGFQCFGNRDESLDDGFYKLETNEIETNDIISPITNDTNNEEIDNITNEINTTNDINAVIEQTNANNESNANTNLQTNNTSTVATNNAININTNNTISQTNTNIAIPQPNLPNPPVITTPPPNPNQNSNQNRTSYLGGNTYRTKWTDTLTSIASSELGDARRWPTIYVMNENIFRDPDSLVFNRDIKIPETKKKIEDMTAEEKRALYDDYMRVAQVYLNIGKTNSANTLRNRARLIVR